MLVNSSTTSADDLSAIFAKCFANVDGAKSIFRFDFGISAFPFVDPVLG